MRKSYKAITILAAISLLLSGCNLFTSTPKYKVTWKNYDGSILEVDEEVEAGTIPTFDGAEPLKAQDAQNNYIFDGWTPAVSEVNADIEYVAKFKEETRKYTVLWKNYDGTLLKMEDVLYGTVPTYTGETPTKESTTEHSYTFDGWSPQVIATLGDMSYTASFKEEKRKYNITWKNEDGSVLRTDAVAYGDIPEYGETAPTKDNTAQYAYTFSNWTPIITSVTGDMEYTAAYNSEVRKYTVQWVNYDGEVLQSKEVAYGELPEYTGSTPKKPKDRAIEYVFKGWDSPIEYVSGDKTYTAQFDQKGVFSFDPVEYEMEEGYQLSDIVGSPWINSNVAGEIDKIKKPSLKDDYYASVNYEAIKEDDGGPFEESKDRVTEAFNSFYDDRVNGTTNGVAIKTFYEKILDGDVDTVKTYLHSIDFSTYFNSKASFTSQSALLRLVPTDVGFEVELNDGYMNSNYASFGFLIGYSGSQSTGKTILTKVSNAFELGINSADIDNIATLEANLINQANNDYYYRGNGTSTFTINNAPWAPMKAALLDLGLAPNTKIEVKNYYYNDFNNIYNNYLTNKSETLNKLALARLAFDCRFFVGLEKYKDINKSLSQASSTFSEEAYLYNRSDDAIAKKLAVAALSSVEQQTYIELDSSEEIKNQVTELINAVLDGYKEMATHSWLGSTTASKMVKKLEKMKYGSCYSDAFKNFADFTDDTTTSKTPFEIFNAYNNAIVTTALNKVVDETTYYFTSMPSWTVNAFYSPGSNIFVILNGLAAGTLGTCIEERYAMLGTVIGHEITHAFDSTGSQFDENGNYKDWWSTGDKSVFKKKVNAMIAFYKKIHLTKTLTVDGDNVNGEATADMGGVKIMLQLAKKIQDFDYDKFFRAYACIWREPVINISAVPGRAQNEHPFEYLRTNVTLAQFDEFIETYDIKEGDGMYIPADQRVKIW